MQNQDSTIYSPLLVDTNQQAQSSLNTKLYFEQIKRLPPGISSLLWSADMAAYLEWEICKKNNLSDVQSKHVVRAVRDVLIGSLLLNNFVSRIEKGGLEPTTATEIANDIAHEVFSKIINELQILQSIGSDHSVSATKTTKQEVSNPKQSPKTAAPLASQPVPNDNIIDLRTLGKEE